MPKTSSFGKNSCLQLLHLADASEQGYGVVTSLRLVNSSEAILCSFIISPLKQTAIPRLELTAVTVAVKVDKLMRKELQMPIEGCVFQSDSTTVLKYISS